MIEERDFEGVSFECTGERWLGKVVASHPELAARTDDVRAAITDPSLVIADRDYTNRKHHIRGIGLDLLIDVVVEYRYWPEGVQGRVVTAFLRRTPPTHGEVLFNAQET